MFALEAKRGVEATLERVFKATGNKFHTLVVAWAGRTAGIKTEGDTTYIMFPSIDETKPVSQTLFNELIGYALHELGHKWFTQDRPWDNARQQHGSYVSALINGLEDPRIEQCVVNSGYAPNARALFEFLTNQVLRKNGYVEADDFKNIPFMLAIEGRRLNGYTICFDSIVNASPYRTELRWALKAAQKANDTKAIVKIAIALYERLKKRREELKQQQEQQQEDNSSRMGLRLLRTAQETRTLTGKGKVRVSRDRSPVMNPANPVINRVTSPVTSPATSPVRVVATAKAVMNQSGVILNRLTSSMTGAARSKRMRMRSAPAPTLASPSF
jgi:hypothetical protein